jgi:RHS repeat-associated protein
MTMTTLLAGLRDLLPSIRLRTVALGAVFAFSTFAVQAAPTELPIDRPTELAPQPVQALGCASEPAFTGYITNTYTTTAAVHSTTGLVRGYISDVLTTWSCTAFYRYDGLAWQRETPTGGANYQWGTLINSTSVPCNWVVGETTYLKANGAAHCHTSDSDHGMQLVLAATGDDDLMERVWHADNSPDAPGDFMFVHSDCTSYYADAATPGQKMRWNTSFSTTDETNRPGNNCDPSVIDGTGTSQSIVVDGTPPVTDFVWPNEGTGPVVVRSAFAGVTFHATDNVAGFSGSANDWDLQRQKATWDGSQCGTFANDTTTGHLTSGTTNAANQTVSQSLVDNTCYRWTLAAKDANGNTASTKTSGTIRTDLAMNHGQQGHQTFESWDLGAGDDLSVNVGTGNLVISHPIVSLPIRGGSFDLNLTYNRHDTGSVGFGTGWRLDAFRRLTVAGNGDVTYIDGDGARHVFTGATGSPVTTYTRPATLYATLTRDTAATPDRFTLTWRDGSFARFDELVANTAYLVREEDRHGNAMTFTYDGSQQLTRIEDPTSRDIDLTWTSGKVTKIEDWAYLAVDGSGVVQTSATGSRRAHRFFYSGSDLRGWADPLAPSGDCTAGGSHITCFTYASGSLSIAKTQTYAYLDTAPNPDVIASATRPITTTVTFTNADVTNVKHAQEVADSGVGTTFSHPTLGGTQVVRAGRSAPGDSPATTTRYAMPDPTESLARVASVGRKLGSSWLTTSTAWDTSYPIEPAAVTEDDGGSLERTTTYTYAPNTLGRLTRVEEPLVGTAERWTDYTYNTTNDVIVKAVSMNGTSVIETHYTYASTCVAGGADTALCAVIENEKDGSHGGTSGHVEDVTIEYEYDAHGQRLSETRHLYEPGSGTADVRENTAAFDANGNQTSEIANFANGAVTSPGDDVTPNATTNARTDLTSVHTYDTAGNRVSTADPRRAVENAKGTSLGADDFITRWTFDALGQSLTEKTPTTPGISVTQKTASSMFDELGLVRTSVDFGDRVSSTAYDRAGHEIATFEDTDGTGASPAVQTSATTVDPQGQVVLSSDQRQVPAPTTLGQTKTEYDEAGRAVRSIEVWASTPLPDQSTTATTYDALDRVTAVAVGTELAGDEQVTRTTYDLGGRAVAVDDEFTCTTTAFDHRDLPTTIVEGKVSGTPCTGAGTRTIDQAFDAMGRMTERKVSGGNVLEASTYDSAGRVLKRWSTEAGSITRAVETDYNTLDQPITEWRYTDTSGTKSNQTWARSNRDPAGNETDRCTWTTSHSEWCKRADQSFTNPPVTVASSEYDARNNRVAQYTPGLGTTTYDPTADYQVAGIYLPTAAGKERQTLFVYDGRHRIDTITEVLCATNQRPCAGGNIVSTRVVDDYEYDGNDNRTSVIEDNGGGSATRHYCYDARNQLITVRSATGCSSGLLETYGFDEAGNRTSALGRTYTYSDDGQLATCSGSPACSPTFDADGRLTKITTVADGTWSYVYDGEGRLVSACKSTSCAGSGFARLDMTYDGEGHRIRLVETPALGSATTTDFRYQGDAVTSEVSVTGATTITRKFTTDEAGAIVKVEISGDPVSLHNGTYLVTWNGHGDAVALSKIDAGTGALTAANRYTYSTWGTPSTTTHNSYADLRFRYLYVGQYDVQWDHSTAVPAGLLYMHARHYSPEFGRFLQADPAALDDNLYAYADSNPTARIDPEGTGNWKARRGGGGMARGGGVRSGRSVKSAGATPKSFSQRPIKELRREFERETRPAFWRYEAAVHPERWTKAQLRDMRQGKAPREKDGTPWEVHHIKPLSQGGTNSFKNLKPLTRAGHRLGPNFRKNHPR